MRPGTGTAEQLAWGPVGGARDVGPPRVARGTPHKPGLVTERETKAQTSDMLQTLTQVSWEPGDPSHLFHVPKFKFCLGILTY